MSALAPRTVAAFDEDACEGELSLVRERLAAGEEGADRARVDAVEIEGLLGPATQGLVRRPVRIGLQEADDAAIADIARRGADRDPLREGPGRRIGEGSSSLVAAREVALLIGREGAAELRKLGLRDPARGAVERPGHVDVGHRERGLLHANHARRGKDRAARPSWPGAAAGPRSRAGRTVRRWRW